MTVEWRLRRTADSSIEGALFDVEVTDAMNRFGRKAIAYIDDAGDDKWPKYPRGTALELEVSDDGGSTWTRRFGGFVVERRERDNNGADELELEIYSYDHFLRRDNLTRDFSGQTISSALKTIVEDFTPVSFVSSNVDVVNDQTLSRGFEGETVDNAIAELASKSGNEEFGVNDDIEFFFQPREVSNAPRDIDNSQWLGYDLPETGKEALNELQLFYGEAGNEGSVVVTDGADKRELQDAMGTDGPVVFREEVTRTDITNDSDARDKAEEILNDRDTTLTGTVTTFGLFDAEPGDVIPIEIVPRDIDDDFRIAEITYRWGPDETEVTVVEQRGGGQARKLVRITDTLKRVEQRAADRSVPTTIYEGPLASRELFSVTATAWVRDTGEDRLNPGFGRDAAGFGRAEPGLQVESVTTVSESVSRVTNALRDAVRDAWGGSSAPTIDTVLVGEGPTTPSRTDTSMDSQAATVDASTVLPDSSTVRFDASHVPTDSIALEELGLESAAGTLHARLTTDSVTVPAHAPVDYRITVSVSNDADAQGVITDSGTTTTRDVIADNDPSEPTQFAFGHDDTDATTSDTALGNEFRTVSLDGTQARQTGVLDLTASLTNDTGQSITLREWGLKDANGTLLSRTVYADIIVEDTDVLNATQRNNWANE